ncbi:MAG: hypothetical protein U5J62_05670 [Desulfurivibrio sp.]|nr:hypothetical protein [Desulfurivibrio sp.]
MVRQLAASVAKDIDLPLAVEGQETVIDKDLIEKMEIHWSISLRNSIDDDIESPERRSRWKNRQGVDRSPGG